jgi:hypothetical protein
MTRGSRIRSRLERLEAAVPGGLELVMPNGRRVHVPITEALHVLHECISAWHEGREPAHPHLDAFRHGELPAGEDQGLIWSLAQALARGEGIAPEPGG